MTFKDICFKTNIFQIKSDCTPSTPWDRGPPANRNLGTLLAVPWYTSPTAVRHSSQSQARPEIKSVVFHAWRTKVFDLQAKFPL